MNFLWNFTMSANRYYIPDLDRIHEAIEFNNIPGGPNPSIVKIFDIVYLMRVGVSVREAN